MAAINPPLFMNQNGVYGADEVGRIFGDIMGEGTVEFADLKVTQDTGSNMQIKVAAGSCWVKGDTVPSTQPTYRCLNDAIVTLAVTGSNPTNPRKDLVYALVTDDDYSGTGKKWEILVATGTPAGSPTRPALPASAIALAEINVAANATAVTNANIIDLRQSALANAGRVVLPAFKVWRSAALTHTAGSGNPQAIAWDTVDYDEGDIVDLAAQATRATIRTPGIYVMNAKIQWAGNGTGARGISIRKNGATEIAFADAIGSAIASSTAVALRHRFAQGDYVEVLGVQSSGGNLSFAPAYQYLYFEGEWIRP